MTTRSSTRTGSTDQAPAGELASPEAYTGEDTSELDTIQDDEDYEDDDEAQTDTVEISAGALVTVLDEDGEPTRYGILVGEGRDPDPDKGESAEPMVIWLPEAAAYGGELTAVE